MTADCSGSSWTVTSWSSSRRHSPLGEEWVFWNSKSTPSDTPPPPKPHLLIPSQQLLHLGTRNGMVWVWGQVLPFKPPQQCLQSQCCLQYSFLSNTFGCVHLQWYSATQTHSFIGVSTRTIFMNFMRFLTENIPGKWLKPCSRENMRKRPRLQNDRPLTITLLLIFPHHRGSGKEIAPHGLCHAKASFPAMNQTLMM